MYPNNLSAIGTMTCISSEARWFSITVKRNSIGDVEVVSSRWWIRWAH